MEQVFSYIISLGASVMMPIIFTVIGMCIGMKFGKALKSGHWLQRFPVRPLKLSPAWQGHPLQRRAALRPDL